MKDLSFIVIRRIGSVIAASLLLAASGMQAATRTWSGVGTDNNWRTTTNWDGAPTTNDTLVFAGSTRLSNNNNFTAPTVFSGITFNSDSGAFVLGGNALRLTGEVVNNSTTPQTVNVAITNTARQTVNCASGDVTLGGVLSGSGVGLTKTGAGTLTLSAANIYPGVTTNSAGTLKLNNAAALPAGTTLVLQNSAVVDLNGFNSTVGNISLSTTANTITNTAAGTGTNTFTIGNQSSTASCLIRDGASRVTAVDLINAVAGGTPFTLNNQNTFSGPLTLRHYSSGTRINLTGTITASGTPGAIVSGPFGRGPIVIGLAPTDRAGLYFSVANITVMNDIIFNTAAGNDTLGTRLDTGNNVMSGTLTANLAPAYFIARSGNGSVVLSGQVTGPSGLTVDAYATRTMTVILSNVTANANNYRGTTTVIGGGTIFGVLQLGRADQIPNGGTAGNVTLTGGTLKLNGFNETINGLSGAGTVDGVSGTPTLTLGDGNATGLTFSGAFKNSAGALALTKIGTGSQTLSGTCTHSGATTLSAGKLVLTTGGSCSNSAVVVQADAGQTLSVKCTDSTKRWTSGGLTFNAGATALQFDFGYYGASVVPSTNVAPLYVKGNVQFDGTPAVTVDAGNLPAGVYPLLTWTGTMLGTAPTTATLPAHIAGSLSVVGDNTLTLTVTANTQPLTWAAGTGDWDLATTASWKDAANATATYQETTLPGDVVFFDDSAAGDGPFAVNLTTTVQPTSVTFTNSVKAYTLTGGGAIAGVTALTKQGNGALTLDTDNTFTGGTVLNAGQLNLNKPAALGAPSSVFTLAGGTLDCTAASPVNLTNNPSAWNADVTFLGSQSLDFGNGAVTLGASRQVTVNSGTLAVGAVAGSGYSLTKQGAGTLALNGTSTYSGGTLVNDGSLNVGAPGGLGSGAVTLVPGTTLNLTSLAANDIVYTGLSTSLSGTGTVNVTLLGSAVTPNTSTRTLNGNYAGFAGTWNVGVGALTNSGKVQMTGPDNRAMSINILPNATLFTLTATHQSALTLYGGDPGESYGQLRLDSGAWAGPITLAGEIYSPDGFVGGYAGTATLSGPIGEAGAPRMLSKIGPNTIVLSGTNTYTGGTAIRGGILQVNASESMGGGDIAIAGGVRLSLGNGVTVTNAVAIGANTAVATRGILEAASGSATLAGPITITNAAAAGGHFASVVPATLYVNGFVYSSISPFFSRLGTVVFSGGGAYRTLDISQDTVRLGADNGLCTTSTVNIASSGTGYLDLGGFDQTLLSVTKGGSAATIGNSSTNSSSRLTLTGTSTYAGVIADSLLSGNKKVALTVKGGTLTLSGSNTHSGTNTVCDGGTLSIAADAALGAAPLGPTVGCVVLSNGTLRTTAASTLSANRGITLGADTTNTLENTTAATASTYVGVIEGSGALILRGSGGWAFGGASTYTGGSTLSNGTIVVSASSTGPAGNPASGPFGAGSATLNLAGSQIRATTAADVSVGNTLAILTNTVFASGTIAGSYYDKNLTFTGPATLARTVTLTVNTTPANGSVALNGAISDNDSGFGLIKSGGGTLVLGGVNTYSGATLVNTGKLVVVTGGSCANSAVTLANGVTNSVRVTDNTAQWSCASLTFNAGSASALEFNFGATVPSTTVAPLRVNGDIAFTGTPTVAVTADALQTDGVYPLLTWTGTLTGTAPSVVLLPPRVSGTLSVVDSTLILTVSTGFNQPLRWSTTSALWDIDTTANWLDSAETPSSVTYLDGNKVQFEDTLSGEGPITVTLNATVSPGSVTVNNPIKDYTVSGTGKISGPTGIAKSGAGMLTLATANDFVGATAITEGMVKLGAAAALGSIAGVTTVDDGATLDFNGQAVGAEPVVVDGSLVNSSATAASLSGPVTVASAASVGGNGTLTLSGILGGSAPLTKTGTNLLVFSGANTHSGVLTINAGTVRAGNALALGSAGAETVVAGGTLDVNNLNLGAEPVKASGAGVDNAGALVNSSGAGAQNAFRFVTLTGNTTFGGAVRWDIRANPTATFDMGGFTLTKTNVNQFSLTGVSVSNPGRINVQQGLLSIETGTTLSGSAANTFTMQPGTTLQYYDLTTPVAWSLALNSNATVYANHQVLGTDNAWAGPVTLNGPATFNSAAVQAVSGAISGTGPLLKTGASSLTLTGANTYGGGTAVTAGTLQLGNGTTANGSVTGDITNSATLTFANPSALSYDGAISGAGTVIKQANGVLTLGGTSPYVGLTQFKAGVVNVASLANYGVPCALGARTQLMELGGASSVIGLHFQGGTLQYTGSTPQSTDRMIRLLGSATGVTNTIDASGIGAGTFSFTYGGKNTNFWETGGKRTLRLTGVNTGDNVFALNIQNYNTDLTSLIKGGPGKWLITNTHNGDALTQSQATYGGYTGGTLLSGGWLGFATNALGSSGLITMNVSSVLEWYGFNSQDISARFKLEDGIIATLNTGTNEVSFGSTLQLGAARNAALTKTGAGTLTLAGTNSFSGATLISEGTLKLGTTNALLSGATVTLAGGTLDVNGKRQTLAALSGSGTLKMNPATGTASADRLIVTGALDLSTVTLSLTGLNLLDKGQTYVLASAGTLTGKFAAVQPSIFQSGWVPRYNSTTGVVTLTYSRGTLILLR